MPNFTLYYGPKVDDDLNSLDSTTRKRVEKKIKKLRAAPEIGKPLRAPLAGLLSVRVGSGLRIVYECDRNDASVTVVSVDRRQAGKSVDVYTRLS